MTSRRSIFKCIPTMIALVVLPKAWTVKPTEPVSVFGRAETVRNSLTVVGETGPEFIAFDDGRFLNFVLDTQEMP